MDFKPPVEFQPPPILPPTLPSATRSRIPDTLYYLLAPVAGALGVYLSSGGWDDVVPLVGGGLAACFIWAGLLRAQPRVILIELLAILLASAWVRPGWGTYWIIGATFAGVTGAVLTRRQAEEDDFFFLPLLAGLAVFAFLLAIATPEGPAGALRQLRGIFHFGAKSVQEGLEQFLTVSGVTPLEASEIIKENRAFLGPLYLALLGGYWSLILWLFGRLARWLAGVPASPRGSIIFFRLRHGYIFILIGALVLEILSVLSGRDGLAYGFMPAAAVCAVALFVEGVAVLLFFVALKRAADRPHAALVFSLMALLVFLMIWPGILLGLTDVWADFRKLRLIRERLEM